MCDQERTLIRTQPKEAIQIQGRSTLTDRLHRIPACSPSTNWQPSRQVGTRTRESSSPHRSGSTIADGTRSQCQASEGTRQLRRRSSAPQGRRGTSRSQGRCLGLRLSNRHPCRTTRGIPVTRLWCRSIEGRFPFLQPPAFEACPGQRISMCEAEAIGVVRGQGCRAPIRMALTLRFQTDAIHDRQRTYGRD